MHNFRRDIIILLLFITVLTCPMPTFAEKNFSENPDAIEKAALSVVRLTTYDVNEKPIMQGSGFLVFDNMTLVTNYHVIEGAALIIADSDDDYEYFVTKVLIASQEKDLAILRFMAPTVMQPLEIAETQLKRGEKIVAIGSPKGLKNSVSFGNISNIYYEDNVNWIQFTAPISHGSSGGALFNDSGKVIGITSASFEEGQNINLAININEIISLWENWDGEMYSLAEYALTQFSKNEELSESENEQQTIIPKHKTFEYYSPENDPSKVYITMTKGDTIDLSSEFASVLKQVALSNDSKELVWYSYKKNAISVNQNGVITALMQGGNFTVIATGKETVHFYIKVNPKN